VTGECELEGDGRGDSLSGQEEGRESRGKLTPGVTGESGEGEQQEPEDEAVALLKREGLLAPEEDDLGLLLQQLHLPPRRQLHGLSSCATEAAGSADITQQDWTELTSRTLGGLVGRRCDRRSRRDKAGKTIRKDCSFRTLCIMETRRKLLRSRCEARNMQDAPSSSFSAQSQRP
jgi:hypothetical protein